MDNHGLAFVSYYFRYSQYVIRGLKNKVGGPMLTTSFFLAASFPQQLTSTLRSSIPCVVPVEPLPNSGKKIVFEDQNLQSTVQIISPPCCMDLSYGPLTSDTRTPSNTTTEDPSEDSEDQLGEQMHYHQCSGGSTIMEQSCKA